MRKRKIREIEIHPGNVVQDNNLLACSKAHVLKVVQMLKTQKGIRLVGGLDARLTKDWFIEELRGLRIDEIWTACDSKESLRRSTKFIKKLRASGFTRHHVRCYAMIGFSGESPEDAEHRLIKIYEAGAYPFAQIYDEGPTKDVKWRRLARRWQRPVIQYAFMKERNGT